MAAIQPSIFKSIFKPGNHEQKSSEPEAAGPEPKSETSASTSFTPIETPKTAQQQELTKTVYSHVARLHVLITGWKKNRDKSYKIARSILALNLHRYEREYFPRDLQPLMESLMEILSDMGDKYEEATELDNRMQALAKLYPNNEPVLTTWAVEKVAEVMNLLGKVMKKEYQLLETAIENIAHTREEINIAIYVGSLGPNPILSTESAFLFSEAGLSFVP